MAAIDERPLLAEPIDAEDSISFRQGRFRRLALRIRLDAEDLNEFLLKCLARERESGALLHLAPVAFGAGILLYFAAPAEPMIGAGASLFLLTLMLALRLERHGMLHASLSALCLIFAGFSIAQWRANDNPTPVIGPSKTVEVHGVVLNVEQGEGSRKRYLIRPSSIGDLPVEELPHRIRLSSGARHEPIQPGSQIRGLARIRGFSGPAYPGGYDFAFFNAMEGLGGSGFFMGAPKPHQSEKAQALAWSDRFIVSLNRARAKIATRIRSNLKGEEGHMAAALLTGDRSGISRNDLENLRASGLAHILAISGLHVALAALTVIGAARFCFAAFPAIALKYPARKIAVAMGCAAATIYLFISGAGIATQRAWIMIAIMLAAILLDRRAITMRNVALAAMIILAISPHALLHPGFQMSFAAAAALTAAYENQARKHPKRIKSKIIGWIAGLWFVSLVAGTATGIVAAWHFHRIAPLGLIANMLAMPVFTIAVMPILLLVMLAMPLGIEAWILPYLGKAIGIVLDIAEWITSISPSGITGLKPLAALLAGATGLMLLVLLRSPLRFSGIAAFAMIPLFWKHIPPPAAIVSEDGAALAVADQGERLVLAWPKRNRFMNELWTRAWPSSASEESRDGVFGECDKDRCVARLSDGAVLHLVNAPALLDDSCGRADILIAPRLYWADCDDSPRRPDLLLKRGDFERRGAHAIRALPGGGYEAVGMLSTSPRPWNLERIRASEAHLERFEAMLAARRKSESKRDGDQ